MARVSKVEACMFCMAVPCECNVKPKAKPAPKRARKEKAEPKSDDTPVAVSSEEPFDSVPSPSSSIRDAMRAAAKKSAAPPVAQVVTEDGITEFEEAIKVLGPLLHPDEVFKYRHLFSPSPERRAKAWRQRNVVGTRD